MVFLRPFVLEWLRFPGEHSGGLRIVLRLFVGLKRTWGTGRCFRIQRSAWSCGSCSCDGLRIHGALHVFHVKVVIGS